MTGEWISISAGCMLCFCLASGLVFEMPAWNFGWLLGDCMGTAVPGPKSPSLYEQPALIKHLLCDARIDDGEHPKRLSLLAETMFLLSSWSDHGTALVIQFG